MRFFLSLLLTLSTAVGMQAQQDEQAPELPSAVQGNGGNAAGEVREQKARKSRYIEMAPMGGFLMPHHNDMLYLVDGHIRGFEGAYLFACDGDRDWHHSFNFPQWGFAAAYYDLASPHLGEALALKLVIDLPLEPQRRYQIRLGAGGGYISKPFDAESNIHNGAIGSAFNSALEISLYRDWQLSSRLAVRAGLGIRHFSNGAMVMPNTGINLAMASLALSYASRSAEALRNDWPERRKIPHERRREVWLGGSFGIKQALPIGGPNYGVGSLFINWQRSLGPRASWGAEAGVNQNSSLPHRSREAGIEPGAGIGLRSYLAAQYLLHLGHWQLRFQMGSYILPAFELDGWVFFRYHLIYQMERWQCFAGLKSHWAKADHIELGLAYRILQSARK